MNKTLYRLTLTHYNDTIDVVQYSFNREELEEIALILNFQDEGYSDWKYEVDEVWTRS